MTSNKRARPAFSPPRPRKSKSQSTTKPKSKTATSKSKSKATSSTTQPSRRRSRLVSPTPSASDSLDSLDSHASNPDADPNPNPDADTSSPEPEYILAEVTHESPTSSTPALPTALIHRILHSQFSEPDTTKISKDAEMLVTKYAEVFVREAIMRCAFEKSGGEDGDGGGVMDKGSGSGGADGWLEVEDLERVAVQLCLDF